MFTMQMHSQMHKTSAAKHQRFCAFPTNSSLPRLQRRLQRRLRAVVPVRAGASQRQPSVEAPAQGAEGPFVPEKLQVSALVYPVRADTDTGPGPSCLVHAYANWNVTALNQNSSAHPVTQAPFRELDDQSVSACQRALRTAACAISPDGAPHMRTAHVLACRCGGGGMRRVVRLHLTPAR